MAKAKERVKVLFLNDHMQMAAEALNWRDCGRLFEMVRAYSMEGRETDVSGESRLFRSLYVMMCRAQDRDIEEYQKRCERNRHIANMRWHPDASDGIQSMPIQDNTRQDKTNQDNGFDDPLDQEGTGVPGIGWLE